MLVNQYLAAQRISSVTNRSEYYTVVSEFPAICTIYFFFIITSFITTFYSDGNKVSFPESNFQFTYGTAERGCNDIKMVVTLAILILRRHVRRMRTCKIVSRVEYD